jgi:hypothetical protein
MTGKTVRHDGRSFALLKKVVRERYHRCCAYCGLSEDFAGGQHCFEVDNFLPKSNRPDLAYDFDNAVYACRHCNALKGDLLLPVEMHPGRTRYADHLAMKNDGDLVSKTSLGQRIILTFGLNDPHLAKSRYHFVEFEKLIQRFSNDAKLLNRSDFKQLYDQLIAYRERWGMPVWGAFIDPSVADFQIIAPDELGNELNERLMSLLHHDPEKIRNLKGTLFEEVIAELLAQRGFEVVKHVGRRGDTGADIFALEKSPCSGVRLRYFVETKLWTGKIGVEVVDRVSGAIVNERHRWGWHVGLIVAPAGWKNMLKFSREELQLLGIELRDDKDVQNWLKNYQPAPSGLWLPLRDNEKILPALRLRK